MSIFALLWLILLFVLFAPGVVIRLPAKWTPMQRAFIHGMAFILIYFTTQKLIWQMTYKSTESFSSPTLLQKCIDAVEQTGFIPKISWGTTPNENRNELCDDLLCPYFKQKYGCLDNMPDSYEQEREHCKNKFQDLYDPLCDVQIDVPPNIIEGRNFIVSARKKYGAIWQPPAGAQVSWSLNGVSGFSQNPTQCTFTAPSDQSPIITLSVKMNDQTYQLTQKISVKLKPFLASGRNTTDAIKSVLTPGQSLTPGQINALESVAVPMTLYKTST